MPQYPPQSTTTTEAQTLRQMVQEREEEIRRLRNALKEAYRLADTFYMDMTDEASDELEAHLVDALDGGGDDHASS